MIRSVSSMASHSQQRQFTDRDLEILTAIDRCPLTAEQLLRLSKTFTQPFTHIRLVRRRLKQLSDSNLLRRWSYAVANRGGTPDYHRLSPAGFRLLYGEHVQPSTRRMFAEIGVARHHHTMSLSNFIVQTCISADHHQLQMMDFCRENSLALHIGKETLFPDTTFTLRGTEMPPLNFYIELDNGSERIRSQRDQDSIERKIRLYDQHEKGSDQRHRVLFVCTRSQERVDHILEAASELVSNKQRTLFCGVYLPDYLMQGNDAVVNPCFLDHRGQQLSLLPQQQKNVPTFAQQKLEPVGAEC